MHVAFFTNRHVNIFHLGIFPFEADEQRTLPRNSDYLFLATQFIIFFMDIPQPTAKELGERAVGPHWGLLCYATSLGHGNGIPTIVLVLPSTISSLPGCHSKGFDLYCNLAPQNVGWRLHQVGMWLITISITLLMLYVLLLDGIMQT